MKKYVINVFKGGISKYSDRGLPGSFQHGKNLNFRTRNNVLTCNQDLIQEGSGVIADLIKFFVPSITGKLYAFGSSGRIYERDASGNWSIKYTEPDGEIRGAAEWYLSNGKTYLFWATATSLHQKELPGASNWSDVDADIVIGSNTHTYPKTNLQDVPWHTMAKAVGNLYIANGEKLAMVGYDGSYTNEALRIFKDERIKSLVEYNNYLLFGTERVDKSERSSLYVWDTISLSWNLKKPIFKGDVNGLIITDIPLAQVGKNSEIFYADMQIPLPIRNIDGGGYINPGGIEVDEGLALLGIFGNSAVNNGIYSFGRKNKDETHVLNLEYWIDCDEIGALCNFDGKIFVSYKKGSSYFVKRVYENNKAVAEYYSLELIPDKNYISTHLWRTINVYLKSMPSGASISAKYRVNKGVWTEANLEDGSLNYSTADGKVAVFFVGETGNIFEFSLTLTPSGNNAPEVELIEVYFD